MAAAGHVCPTAISADVSGLCRFAAAVARAPVASTPAATTRMLVSPNQRGLYSAFHFFDSVPQGRPSLVDGASGFDGVGDPPQDLAWWCDEHVERAAGHDGVYYVRALEEFVQDLAGYGRVRVRVHVRCDADDAGPCLCVACGDLLGAELGVDDDGVGFWAAGVDAPAAGRSQEHVEGCDADLAKAGEPDPAALDGAVLDGVVPVAGERSGGCCKVHLHCKNCVGL